MKTITKSLLVGGAVLALAACQKTDTDAAAPEATPEATPTETPSDEATAASEESVETAVEGTTTPINPSE